MAAALVPAAISGIGSVVGGIAGGKGAKKAAKIQAQSTREQMAFLTGNRDYQYDLNAPQIASGRAADDRIAGLLNIGGDADASRGAFDSYKASTGYDTRLHEALTSVNQRAFAGGAGQSGANLKALQDRGADVAGRYFDTYLGQLGGVSATGAGARSLVANVGTSTTNNLVNASQNGATGQINAVNAGNQNFQSTLQNLINAGSFAYGSSYGGAGKSGGGYVLPPPSSNGAWYQGY